MRIPVYTALTLTAYLIGAGCSSSPDAVAPMDLAGQHDTTWEYLSDKYDVDGDGVIALGEYDRPESQFDRLDRNEDGSISIDDFERRGGPGGNMQNMMRGMMAQRLVSTYFQNDDDNAAVALTELERSIGDYDSNGDDAIDADEFDALSENRKVEAPGSNSRMMRRAMADMKPWDVLLDGVDDDDDDRLSRDELVGFFKSRDDGDLVWTLRGGGGGRGNARRSASSDRPKTGAGVGTVAPDFTLNSPDGEQQITLSAFRDDRPVALIFGSYT